MKTMKKYAILFTALLAAACNSGEEQTTTTVEEACTRIVEYTPAPGQFINEPASGFQNVTTQEAACRYAEERIAAGNYVSLGGWGGYIVAKFDTPVPAANSSAASSTGGYDLWVKGNQMSNASEPGIVWVAPDADGDGTPDEWFELRGSEYGKTGYIRNYSVTYTRPAAAKQDVAWTDSEGASGTIDYLPQYGHTQDSYYPAWISNNTLTFSGSRLPANGTTGQIENTSSWLLKPFEWGYADNLSEVDALRQVNRFRISDAVTADGTPANLREISFIKVQTGVNGKSPIKDNNIGETSTEVCGLGCYRTITRFE